MTIGEVYHCGGHRALIPPVYFVISVICARHHALITSHDKLSARLRVAACRTYNNHAPTTRTRGQTVKVIRSYRGHCVCMTSCTSTTSSHRRTHSGCRRSSNIAISTIQL